MLTRVLQINKDTGERRLLKTWFYRTKHRLLSLGTADRQEAENRAHPLACLLKAVFGQTNESFTDKAPLSHETVAQENLQCS